MVADTDALITQPAREHSLHEILGDIPLHAGINPQRACRKRDGPPFGNAGLLLVQTGFERRAQKQLLLR